MLYQKIFNFGAKKTKSRVFKETNQKSNQEFYLSNEKRLKALKCIAKKEEGAPPPLILFAGKNSMEIIKRYKME